MLLLNKLETAITILLRRVPPIPLIKNSGENGIFGPTTLILALLDRFISNNGDFPLIGRDGVPPNFAKLFSAKRFSVQGVRGDLFGSGNHNQPPNPPPL